MSNDNKNGMQSKKGLPGGFFILLLAAIFLFLTLQNMHGDKKGQIAFSHQVEHLVNLDLIRKEESRKIALNDNLVTFSGKFKETLSEDAKARYRYLELLNRKQELTVDQARLQKELAFLSQRVKESADWFLHLSGRDIPQSGYRIVDPIYDTNYGENAITLRSLSDKQVVSLKELEKRFEALKIDPNTTHLLAFNKDLLALIHGYRSTALGIGQAEMKDQLKSLEEKSIAAATLNPQEQIAFYQTALHNMSALTEELAKEQNHIRLLELRSVRSYMGTLDEYNKVSDALAQNQLQLDKARQSVAQVIWFFNNLELSTRVLETQDREAFFLWFAEAKEEWEDFANNRGAIFKAPDQPRNTVLEKTFKSEEPSPNYFSYLFTVLPVLLVVMLLYFVFSRQMKGGVGSGAMNFGKSPARLLTKESNKITFKDVAGCEEAKEELREIVDFLKDPSKFTALGAHIPKGVLCIGAPGTGKTLIAKAVAGEADRPFFSISGSDFVEMFVGVGASRIRDLFSEAKKQAPCIIFMDEIDAVGRHRGAGIGGGHDEREQTLNQLLVEMDGFDTNEGVILIAATNRPDVLDRALLRPGRFDRRIVIDLPDIKGRFDILKVHARRIKLDASVDLMHIARNTPGASGADLGSILNEAALLAARKGRTAVTAAEATEACDKVRYGKERRSLEVDEAEKKTTAYHESGHAIVALVVKHGDPVDKVTIIPRGASLGATHFMPKKNRLSYWRKELLDQLAILMGGRVAEEIFVGDMSSGAQMDITQATRLVRSMICEWGMNDALGTVAYDERSESGQYLGTSNYREKNYSEETAKAIDAEVRKLMNEAHQKAVDIITEHKDKVQLMTDLLMKYETLDRHDALDILNGTWNTEQKEKRLKMEEELHRPTPPIVNTDEQDPIKPPFTDDPSPQQI